jgi:tRNA-dihydrouridine synthase C
MQASSAQARGELARTRLPGAFALAPMDGVTDHVYRELLTSHAPKGRIAFCVSEFIRVTDRPMPDSVIRRSCPEVGRHGVTRSGVPVMLQLLGGQPEPLAETALRAVRLGAWGIDLNFGCPAKLVNRHDGGASLLRCPDRLERIVARVRAVVPEDRPVSVKIRLGWESADEVVPIAMAAERGGASWLTIHGRTKKQMYGPPADWGAIGRARAAVGIDVVANGDLNAVDHLERCRVASGCSHFMLGRGPMGRPSLVCGPADAAEEDEAGLLADLLLEYVEHLSSADKPEERQIARVKQWLSLGATANPSLTPLFDRVKRLRTRADLSLALQS